jgi:uncharacterized membrane protein HdeD (DUF308 family)
VGGILTLVSIFVDRRLWGWKLFAGVIGVWAGLSVIQHPLWSAVFLPTVLVILLGIQGIFYGIVYIIEAIKGLGWGTAILGALSILMGVHSALSSVVCCNVVGDLPGCSQPGGWYCFCSCMPSLSPESKPKISF